MRARFWETVPLEEMTNEEWEALCDGCGKCCLLKLEDEDSGRVHYTNVTCRLFDCDTRSCQQYTLRRMFVQGCVVLTPENIDETATWMPATCAYRRLHEGRGLAPWPPWRGSWSQAAPAAAAAEGTMEEAVGKLFGGRAKRYVGAIGEQRDFLGQRVRFQFDPLPLE